MSEQHQNANHLTYFKIQNFKKFDSLEVKDIGTINLVVGDNNIGKTTFLESLLFSDNSIELIQSLHKTLCLRGFHIHLQQDATKSNGIEENYLKFILRDLTKPLIINYKNNGESGVSNILFESAEFNKLSKQEIEGISRRDFSSIRTPQNFAKFRKNNEEFSLNWIYGYDLLHDGTKYYPIITSNAGYYDDLITYFNELQNDKTQVEAFIKNLSIIISNVEDVFQHSLVKDKYHLCIRLKDDNSAYPITRFGDGAVKLARILLEVTKSKGNRLMIDEIGDGIHYSRLKEFWRTVIKACFLNNVQLFATTHSYECIEVFSEILKEPEFIEYQKNSRLIEFKQKNNEIETITFNYEEFSTFIENENEIRGQRIRD